MKKNYDFSKGEKNPYYKKLKNKKLQAAEEVSFSLNDLVSKGSRPKQESLEKKVNELSQRILKLEKKLTAKSSSRKV